MEGNFPSANHIRLKCCGEYKIPACGSNLSKVAIQRAIGSYGCMEFYDRLFPAERFMRPICGFSGIYGGRDFIYVSWTFLDA